MFLFKHHPYDFESIYRPPYELVISIVWIVALFGVMVTTVLMGMPTGIMWVQVGVCAFMALFNFGAGFKVYKLHVRLLGFKQEFIKLYQFVFKTKGYCDSNKIWLGKGFTWAPEQTQRFNEILKHNWGDLANHLSITGAIKYRFKMALKVLNGEKLTVKKKLSAAMENKLEHESTEQIKAETDPTPQKTEENETLKYLLYPIRLLPALWTFMFPPKYKSTDMGCRWLHGLSDSEDDVAIPIDYFKGHCLILGTTGSGKTRLAELLNAQAIMRGECLIIIDPKGDKEMKENAKRACDAYRKVCIATGKGDPGDRFYSFHPAFPEESVRLNLLANIARDTDVASRITNLMPSKDGGMDPFTAFGWLSVNTIAQALLLLGENPSIESIKFNLLDSMQTLTDKAIEQFCKLSDLNRIKNKDDSGSNYKELYSTIYTAAKDKGRITLYGRKFELDPSTKMLPLEAETLIKCQIFSEHYLNEPNSSTIASLVKLYQHPKEHFAKMINNMLPILEMLSTGTLSSMLSMSNEGQKDGQQSEQISTMDIIKGNGVLYVGLDSLSDGVVGGAIGSLLLSDLTAAAGQIYNFFDGETPPINVFVDEAAECLNDPCIRLLNKGRGAKYRLVVATQTISDFVSRLGSKDKAYMVLGNVNNKIALRTEDTNSQKYLCEDLPETYIKERSLSQGQNSLVTNPLEHGSTQSEQLKETKVPMVSPQMFGLLPNCEYIANFAGGRIIKGRLPIIGEDYNKVKKVKKKAAAEISETELKLRQEISNQDTALGLRTPEL